MRPLLIACCLLSSCNTPTDPKTPEYWVYRLDREREREEALRKLGELKDPKAVDPLLKLFADEPKDRPAIADALGAIGDKRAVPALLAAIDPAVGPGQDEATRLKHKTNEKAAAALGAIKAPEAADVLLKLYGASRDQYVRQATITAMGAIADKKFVPALCEIVQREDNMFLKGIAADALGVIGDASAVGALIEGMYIEKNASIYPQASLALLRIGPPAIPALLQTLNRKNEAVNRVVAERKFVDGVIEIKAVEVLGDLKALQAEDAMLKLFTEFKNPQTEAILKRNIAVALAHMNSKKAVELLIKNAGEPAGDLRQFYVNALVELGDRAALGALLAAAKKGDQDGVTAAFVAYTRLGDARELATATAIGKGEAAKDVARLAVSKECAETFACWVGKLKDKDARVREKAAYVLGRMGDKKAAEPLAAAVKDENLDTRYAIVWALGRVGTAAQAPALDKVLADEKGQQQFVRVNEYLKRLIIDLKRS